VIWERKDDGSAGPKWVERQGLKGHKIGVAQVGFSRNGQYLVSLGDNEDRGLIVWDLQRGGKQEKRMFSNKLGKPVYQFSFFCGAGSEFFVTAGQDHFKFWYFEDAMKKRNPQ
jgi:WD40 repeat protein